MKANLFFLPLLLAAALKLAAAAPHAAWAKPLPPLSSPNRALRLQFGYDRAGGLTYTFSAQSKVLLQESALGLDQPGARLGEAGRGARPV